MAFDSINDFHQEVLKANELLKQAKICQLDPFSDEDIELFNKENPTFDECMIKFKLINQMQFNMQPIEDKLLSIKDSELQKKLFDSLDRILKTIFQLKFTSLLEMKLIDIIKYVRPESAVDLIEMKYEVIFEMRNKKRARDSILQRLN